MAGRFRSDLAATIPCVAAMLACLATPVLARPVRQFAVPAGPLPDALLVYAQQAGVSIAVRDPRLARLRAAGLHGRYDIAEALRRLLNGSGLTFAFTDASTVRLIPAAPPRVHSAPSFTRVRAAPPPPATGAEIVVTATKQHATLADYPASIALVQLTSADTERRGGQGTAYVLERLPGLASTNLGPGRNKVFIRGVADSSFNGNSQATISQYLGEGRLIYSAPDPDLLLYDIERVEVLEGPQGTLYGAGTLGGIIRLVPHAPDLSETSLGLSTGLRLTRGGAPGFDVAGVVNLPLSDDRLAARVVAYGSSEGGYIGDVLRGRSNINRDRITGIRGSLRWKPAPDWTVDFGVVAQDIASRDGQYAQTDVGGLARASAIAQPFHNDYRLAIATITHSLGGTELVSATGYTRHTIDTVFDATVSPGTAPPRIYENDNAIRLLSHETRLSGRFGGEGRWLVGVSVLHNRARSIQRLGNVGEPLLLASVSNTTLDSAAFGEATTPAFANIELTVGGRLSYVRQTSEFAGADKTEEFEPRRTQFRVLPTTALAWKRHGLVVYVRYQEGYRPGTLQIVGLGDQATAQRFERDHIGTLELGIRFGTQAGARLSGSLAASTASWEDIQADLVDTDGLPFTANIGSGRVRNFAASLAWRPDARLTLDASGFVTASDLSKPAPEYTTARDRDLPNIAATGWRLAVRHESDLAGARLSLDAALRYVGRSKLAVRPPFNLPQGGFYDLSLGGHLSLGDVGLSVDVGNALNAKANTFAFGNPFSLAQGNQSTPLRPRSVRIGFDASF